MAPDEMERLASFYLGKISDPKTGKLGDKLFYDARDLTTHAVCVGMTGSGKTGLCIDVLEEAALDGIPSLIIDPKGDITNMLLTFPELRPADFQPWVNVDDARRKGMTVEEYAASTADSWAKGLAEWDEGPDRIRRLKESAEFVIFTPGSDAGLPVSVLQSFTAPALSWDEHEEDLREKIAGTVSALLELAGIHVESLHAREHVLLSHIFEHAWRQGQDLDLATLIMQIQNPPVRKLGVFDVDTYFPEKQRLGLAMALNNVIASPSFETWLEGVPLDIEGIVRTSDGRPRVAIFYIAHLGDGERMFFVTLLLQQILTWMRSLSGTTSLRGILYFDEVFGYFPPHPHDPPSKRPLLTLLKQARAFGLGVALVTQNPVDLDYKGLTNAGTWFIGKLQTDRDKMRVLEGLETVSMEEGARFDRAYFDRLITSLNPRQFILHNVHAEAPVVFTTRWAMSYLRGPLTRTQVRELMRDYQGELVAVPVQAPARPPSETPVPESREGPAPPAYAQAPPALSPAIPQYFIPVAMPASRALQSLQGGTGTARLLYEPVLLMAGSVHFLHRASGTHVEQSFVSFMRAEGIGTVPNWDHAESLPLRPDELEAKGDASAFYADVPGTLADAARLKALKGDFADYLYHSRVLIISSHPALKLYAKPEDTPEDFRRRCEEALATERLAGEEKIRQKYASRLEKLEERLRREEKELEEDRIDYESRKQEELLSAGETLVGMFVGRRRSAPLSTASRRRRMTKQAKVDLDESEDSIIKLKKETEDLQQEMEEEISAMQKALDRSLDDIEEVQVHPRRADIVLNAFGLGWLPLWECEVIDASQKKNVIHIPAYAEMRTA